jgi:hypothetical protein
MTGALRHRLRHPFHHVVRWGLYQPFFVCMDDDKEWMPSRFWQRVLSR